MEVKVTSYDVKAVPDGGDVIEEGLGAEPRGTINGSKGYVRGIASGVRIYS